MIVWVYFSQRNALDRAQNSIHFHEISYATSQPSDTVGFDSVIQLTESQPESAVKFSF